MWEQLVCGQRATWSVEALGEQGAQGREDGHSGISVGHNQEREGRLVQPEDPRARQRQGPGCSGRESAGEGREGGAAVPSGVRDQDDQDASSGKGAKYPC